MPAISKSWVSIADTAVDPDSPIDAALMTGLRDNDIHLREWLGASYYAGAVQNHNHDGINSANVVLADNSIATSKYIDLSITEPKLGPSAVSQSKLKTTTASGSIYFPTAGASSYTLTGGTYSWWTASSSAGNGMAFANGDTAAGVIGLYSSENGTYFYVDERYVQASPPYALGPLFVFAALDASGNVVHSQVAPDPPWAYHGPTDITPQHWRDGKPYRFVRTVNGVPLPIALQNPGNRRAWLNSALDVREEEIEITQDYKDSDMSMIPHPFLGVDLTGLHVVMLEPGTALMARLAEWCDLGEAREVRKLISGGHLAFDNVPLDLQRKPPGVDVIRVRLK